MWLGEGLLLVCFFGLPHIGGIRLIDLNSTAVSSVIAEWMTTGDETESFKNVVRALSLPRESQQSDWMKFSGKRGSAFCTVCRSVARIAISSRRAGASTDALQRKIIRLCTLLKLQTSEVCRGVVELNAPTLMYIIDGKPSLTAQTVCGLIFQKDSCIIVDEEYEWTVEFDRSGRRVASHVDGGIDDPLRVLQISDIHYDPNYEPYGNADCREPTCCRRGQRDGRSAGKLAGFWGDYNNCDTPWHSVVDVLDHIERTHKDLDFVYFTGDIIDHGVWETTREGNIESLRKSYTRIRETFPNTAVYPIIGNHEPHPLNLFAPTNVTDETFSTQWLYEMLADMWIEFGWLPEATRSTIRRGGFYTVSPRRGFRVVALNNNVCYTYNWWLLYLPRDPYGQLQWLASTLSQAEKDNEFVHILAHIPPGSDECYSTWKREYLRIVDRYAHVISAQFNGHTHNDEVQIIYSADDVGRAVNVAWNGGSVTTYTKLNPNYKLYSVDAVTYAVRDLDNWMYNLTLANEHPTESPNWHKSYSFKKEYGIHNFSLEGLSDWVAGMSRDKVMLERYHRNFFKHAEPSLTKPCNAACREAYIRRMTVIV